MNASFNRLKTICYSDFTMFIELKSCQISEDKRRKAIGSLKKPGGIIKAFYADYYLSRKAWKQNQKAGIKARDRFCRDPPKMP